MKHRFLAMFVLLTCTMGLSADEWLASSYGWLYRQDTKDLVETSIQFYRETRTELLYLSSRDFSDQARIYLPDWSFGIIKKAMIKFLEWEHVARTNKTTLKKDLPDGTIKGSVTWTMGDTSYQADRLELRLQIVSKDATNHYFAFSTNKVNAAQNSRVSYELTTVYLSAKDVTAFLKKIPE